MKRIRLGIKTSEHTNYQHHVFRSTRQTDLPDNLEVLAQLLPVVDVREALRNKDAAPVHENLFLDKTKAPREYRTPFKLTYDPLVSAAQEFVLHILDTGTGAIQHLTLTFNNSGVIQAISSNIVNNGTETPGVMETTFVEVINTNVYIAESLLLGSKSVSADYFIKVVTAFDDNELTYDGIDYHGPVATGLSAPNVIRSIVPIQVGVDANIPTMSVRCNGGDQGVVYFYRIVSEDTSGNISEPSPLFSTLLRQDAANLTYKLEGSFDYGTIPNEEVVWETLINNALHDLSYNLGIPGDEDLGTPIVRPEVPSFLATDISVDQSRVVLDNRIELSIPNVWKENRADYNMRKTRALRAVARDMFGNISEISPVAATQSVLVPIERISCVKKDVSLMAEGRGEPVSIAEGALVKDWVRIDGRFYDGSTMYEPEWTTIMESVAAGKILTQTASTLDRIGLMDFVAENQIWNYTFHIFDVYGNKTVVPLVVDTTVVP